jgi:lipoyl(octanoyl) transferase
MSDAGHPALVVRRLGVVDYAEALAAQKRLVQDRRDGLIQDQLLLLEHPHVITRGSSATDANILADAQERAARGISLFDSGRGGDVTYHGPGQLVGYPILDLKPDRKDLHQYLRDLEQVLIHVLGDFDLQGVRVKGLTGVWVGDRKVAAIGVRVSSGWITSHGFALNVDTDLSYFSSIVPCGIPDREVTSLTQVLGHPVTIDSAVRSVQNRFAEHFGCEIHVGPATLESY